MCGRYTLSTPVGTLADEFGIAGPLPELQPSYNVAPTQEVPAVVAGGGGGDAGWRFEVGLIPSWADDPDIDARMLNARSETVAEKPSFRRAFKERRCLIPADGFYEWQKTNDGKQPYYFRMESGHPFAFAGLWESWVGDQEGEIHTCTILTTLANDLVGEVHNRTPAILPHEDYELWLNPDVREPEELLTLLAPCLAVDMQAYPVSRRVNRPSNNGLGCIEPAA